MARATRSSARLAASGKAVEEPVKKKKPRVKLETLRKAAAAKKAAAKKIEEGERANKNSEIAAVTSEEEAKEESKEEPVKKSTTTTEKKVEEEEKTDKSVEESTVASKEESKEEVKEDDVEKTEEKQEPAKKKVKTSKAEEKEDEPDVSAGKDEKKVVTIEHCKSCGAFRSRAGKIVKAVGSKAKVDVNKEKPGKGNFIVTVSGADEPIVELKGLKRPFPPLKALDMDEVIGEVMKAIGA